MGRARCRRECALAGVSGGGEPRDARVTSVPKRPLEFISTSSPARCMLPGCRFAFRDNPDRPSTLDSSFVGFVRLSVCARDFSLIYN